MSAAGRQPAKPDIFANHPIAQLLGVRLTSVSKRRVRAELPVQQQHMNRGGRVAGGVIMTLADLIGARGTVANLPPGARTTTLESKTNFFAPGEPPLLKAVSIPLHIGRTTMVWQTTVRNADGRMVAVVTQTQIVLMPRTEAPVVRANGSSAAAMSQTVRTRGGAAARAGSGSATRSSIGVARGNTVKRAARPSAGSRTRP